MGSPIRPQGPGNWTSPRQVTNNTTAPNQANGTAQARGGNGNTSNGNAPAAGGHRQAVQLNNVSVQNAPRSQPTQRNRANAGSRIDLPSYLGNRQNHKKSGTTVARSGSPSLASLRSTLNDASSIKEHGSLRNRIKVRKDEEPEGESSGKMEISKKFREELGLEVDAVKVKLDTWNLKIEVASTRIREKKDYIAADCDEKARSRPRPRSSRPSRIWPTKSIACTSISAGFRTCWTASGQVQGTRGPGRVRRTQRRRGPAQV